MEVVDARGRRALDAAVGHARTESAWLLFHLALVALTVWIALHGVAGVAPALLWFVAGAATAELLTSVRSTATAWRESRRLRRCARCVGLVADQDEAYELGRRCARAGHRQVTR